MDYVSMKYKNKFLLQAVISPLGPNPQAYISCYSMYTVSKKKIKTLFSIFGCCLFQGVLKLFGASCLQNLGLGSAFLDNNTTIMVLSHISASHKTAEKRTGFQISCEIHHNTISDIYRPKSDGRRIRASRQKPDALSIRRRDTLICDRPIKCINDGMFVLQFQICFYKKFMQSNK